MEIRTYQGFVREDHLYRWPDKDFEHIINGHRRAIAGYQQALELYIQGPNCFMADYEDSAVIFQGKRYVIVSYDLCIPTFRLGNTHASHIHGFNANQRGPVLMAGNSVSSTDGDGVHVLLIANPE